MKLRLLYFAFAIFYRCPVLFAGTSDIDTTQMGYNLRTTVEAYDKVGNKNPKWDADARMCLTNFASIRSWSNGYPSGLIGVLQTNLSRLAEDKCDDPLIRYLYIRFVYSDSHSATEDANAYGEVASALQKSQYPEIRKFYATIRASSALKASEPKQPEIRSLLESAASSLAKALADKSMPLAEVDQTCDQLMSEPWWAEPARWNCYRILEPTLTNHSGGTSVALLAKGRAYLSYAWQARGIGYANTVSDDAAKLMAERLNIAADSLEEAWTLNPHDARICREMMRVELGQGKGRERLELWFQRGMKLDSANYGLCADKMEYLRPRWYGSINDMIAFGRECTLNTNWSGEVRLMLADAHYEASREIQDNAQRAAYWRKTNVWSDIQFSYEQFFKLYPTEVGYRHNYARYAGRCGQWQDFLKQVKLFPWTNVAYFGGQDQFNKMVKFAEDHVKKQ